MRYSVLFYDENRFNGEVLNFEFLKILINSINAVKPIKCFTVFFDEENKSEVLNNETENEKG